MEKLTYGIVICGDPKRKKLAQALYEIYTSYGEIDVVKLYYEKNPAIAFNKGAREMKVDTIIGIAGDVFVGEMELMVMIRWESEVVFARSPLTPRQKDAFGFPPVWSALPVGQFISGLFKAPRELICMYPFPEFPSFVEDYLWDRIIRQIGIVPLSLQVPCVHIDVHPLIRKRTFQYFLFHLQQKTSLKKIVKMFGWEWQEVWSAIKGGE